MIHTAKLLLGLTLIFAAAVPTLADESVITGTVVYRERILLPDGAQVTVRLEDESSAITLSEVTIPGTTSPTAFTLPFPSDEIRDDRTYGFSAEIAVDGKIIFASANPRLIPWDKATVDGIELLVIATGDPEPSAPIEPTGTIVGSWAAVDIGGTAIVTDSQPTLNVAADGTVNGHAGCNGYGGMATIDGDKVTFGPLAGTMMACEEPIMGQENRFHAALGQVASYKITDDGSLVLLDAAGAELVTFVHSAG